MFTLLVVVRGQQRSILRSTRRVVDTQRRLFASPSALTPAHVSTSIFSALSGAQRTPPGGCDETFLSVLALIVPFCGVYDGLPNGMAVCAHPPF